MATLPAANYLTDPARTTGEGQAAWEAWLSATKQIPGAGQTELAVTISGGAITPAGGGGVLAVDTEAAASTDDLTNIIQTNYPDGSMIMLRNANNARAVVLKHAATGAGQLFLSRSVDYVLDVTTKFVLLQRRGTDWYEIYRAPARLEMPVVTKSSTFTIGKEHHGYLLLCTGSMTVNVPAAATLGNGFTCGILNANTLDNTITVDFAGTELLDEQGIWVIEKGMGTTMVCDGSNFYSMHGYFRKRLSTPNYGTTVTISAWISGYHEVGILTGNVTTLSMNNPRVGDHVRIRFQQDATGGRTVANPSGSKVSGNLASAANQVSYLDLTYCAGSLRWEGFWTQIPL